MNKVSELQKAVTTLEEQLNKTFPDVSKCFITLIDAKDALLRKQLSEHRIYMTELNKKLNKIMHPEKQDDSELQSQLNQLAIDVERLRTDLNSKETLSLTKRKIAKVLAELYPDG